MSFLPIIKDIIPLIMPSPVHITKSSELSSSTGQTDGMIRQGAIIGRSASICGSLMTAKPHSASAIHHHGGQDTIVYAVSGRGAIVTCPKGKETENHNLEPGDWALIPAWTEHREVNEGDEDVVWVITRSGGTPEVVNLKGWGEGEAKS